MTVRIKARRNFCKDEDRQIEVVIGKDGFENFYSARDLEGCNDPLTFDFIREIREPGDWVVIARLQPSNETSIPVTLEVR